MHCRPVFICLYVKRINVVCYFARKEGTRLLNCHASLPAEPEYFPSQFLKITLVTHLFFDTGTPPTPPPPLPTICCLFIGEIVFSVHS